MVDQSKIAEIFNDFMSLYLGREQTGIEELCKRHDYHRMLMGLLSKMRLIRRLSLEQMLFEAAVYMVEHPKRLCNYRVSQETGTASDGFGIVRGKNPRAIGKTGEVLLILKEEQDSPDIEEIALIKIDRKRYHPDRFYDAYGKYGEKGKI